MQAQQQHKRSGGRGASATCPAPIQPSTHLPSPACGVETACTARQRAVAQGVERRAHNNNGHKHERGRPRARHPLVIWAAAGPHHRTHDRLPCGGISGGVVPARRSRREVCVRVAAAAAVRGRGRCCLQAAGAGPVAVHHPAKAPRRSFQSGGSAKEGPQLEPTLSVRQRRLARGWRLTMLQLQPLQARWTPPAAPRPS